MIWQDFKELNFIPFNEDARIYLSYWTLERALILYPLENVEIVQIYAWVWRICVNIQMTAISSPNHAMFYILSASQLLCKFHANKSEIVAKLARTVQIMPASLATIKDNLCVQNSYLL